VAEDLGAEAEERLQLFRAPSSWPLQKRVEEAVSSVLSSATSVVRSTFLG